MTDKTASAIKPCLIAGERDRRSATTFPVLKRSTTSRPMRSPEWTRITMYVRTLRFDPRTIGPVTISVFFPEERNISIERDLQIVQTKTHFML